jgi:hypothetical protein
MKSTRKRWRKSSATGWSSLLPEEVRSVLHRYEEKMLKRQNEYLSAKTIQDWTVLVMVIGMIVFGVYTTVSSVSPCLR